MLLCLKTVFGKSGLLIQPLQQHIVFFFLFVCFCIYAAESFKYHSGRRHAEPVLSGRDPHRGRLIFCRLHPACHKPLPYQLIQGGTDLCSENPSWQPAFWSRRWDGWPHERPGCCGFSFAFAAFPAATNCGP